MDLIRSQGRGRGLACVAGEGGAAVVDMKGAKDERSVREDGNHATTNKATSV